MLQIAAVGLICAVLSLAVRSYRPGTSRHILIEVVVFSSSRLR